MNSALSDTNVDAASKPFASSDMAFDFWSDAHCLAAEQLGFAVNSEIPLTLLLGDAGAGKSMILRSIFEELSQAHLLGHLDDASRMGVFPCNTILTAFGAKPETETKDTPVSVLHSSFASARKSHGLPTLLVDGADNFKDETLAQIFEMARLTDSQNGPVFKVILCGNPDLPDKLQPRFAGLIGPSIRVGTMSDQDAEEYILHRLGRANYRSVMFSDDALKTIVKYAKGSPRLINTVCQAALDEFQGSTETQIETPMVLKCFVLAGYALRRERETDALG